MLKHEKHYNIYKLVLEQKHNNKPESRFILNQ